MQNNLVTICPVALPLMELLVVAKTFYLLEPSDLFLSTDLKLIKLLIQKLNIISENHVEKSTVGDFKMLYNLFSENTREFEFLEERQDETLAVMEYCLVFKTNTYGLGFNQSLFLVKTLTFNSFVFRELI